MILSTFDKTLYYAWMTEKAFPDINKRNSYSKLLDALLHYDFQFDIPMDENRFYDGISLRYRFGSEVGFEPEDIRRYIDDCPCTMLELMVSLSIKMEEQMSNPEKGDRTSVWFYEMLYSLGLLSLTDDHYIDTEFLISMEKFKHHDQDLFGHGGLFTLRHPFPNIRETEIWIQMQTYIRELCEEEDFNEKGEKNV